MYSEANKIKSAFSLSAVSGCNIGPVASASKEGGRKKGLPLWAGGQTTGLFTVGHAQCGHHRTFISANGRRGHCGIDAGSLPDTPRPRSPTTLHALKTQACGKDSGESGREVNDVSCVLECV